MAVGRKPKPDHLKVLQGTARADRSNADAPEPSTSRPVPPAGLSDCEIAHFEETVSRLEEIGCASETFTRTITMYAQRLAEIDELSEEIEREGRSYESNSVQGGRMVRAYPWVAQRNDAMRHAQSLQAELCLTPSTIGKARPSKRKPGEDKWARFKKSS